MTNFYFFNKKQEFDEFLFLSYDVVKMFKFSSQNSFWLVIVILVVAVMAGNIVYPNAWNKVADFVNNKYDFSLRKIDSQFHLGLDIEGGTHLVYKADTSKIQGISSKEALESARDVIERRVNLFGVAEPIVQVSQSLDGEQRLIVELAGVNDVKQAISMIGQTPFLEFKREASKEEIKQADLLGFISTKLNGSYLKRAQIQFDQISGLPMVTLQFNSEGGDIFAELTKENLGKRIAIYLDGFPVSVPVVQSVITGGNAQISGQFTQDEAILLRNNLNAGALPVPIEIISQQTIGASLGKDSLDKMIFSGMIASIALVVFMILYYRLPGLIGIISLAVYIVIILFIYKLIPVTLTLSGIAGFILSLGMAVDANVLIFERLKEELRSGRGLEDSVQEGFIRAWSSIRIGNVSTILTALIIYVIGTSFVQGFALTLGIGILFSMFTAVFLTRLILIMLSGTKLKNNKFIWKTII
ncbi:MAG: protein translocase subunit SecD [Patescibacteria group bacterium]